MKKFPLIITIFSLFILTACGVQTPIEGVNQLEETNGPESAQQEIERGSEIQPDPLVAPEEVEEVFEPYKLVDKERISLTEMPFIKQDLVKVDPQTKEETVLVENLHEKHKVNFRISRGVIEGSNKLILIDSVPETDRPSSKLYSLDVDTLELKDLSINEVEHHTFVKAIAPNGKYMAWAPFFYGEEASQPIKKIYLIDLLNGAHSDLIELAEGETLNSNEGWPDDSIELEWLDDNTLKYAVYKHDSTNAEGTRELLEYREIEVK